MQQTTVFILSVDPRDVSAFKQMLTRPPGNMVWFWGSPVLQIATEDMAERIILPVKFTGVRHDLHWDEIKFDPNGNALLACAFERGNLKYALAMLERDLESSMVRGDYLLTLPPYSPR